MLYRYLTLVRSIKSLRLRPDNGATAVEYGLLVALIAAVIIGAVAAIGLGILPGFQTVDAGLP